MKIHLTGTDWHGATTANLKRALGSFGHEVLFFEKNLSRGSRIARNLALRFARRPYEAENYFYEITSRRWFASLKAFGPDLVLIEDAPNVLAEYVSRARSLGKPIFYYEISPPQGAGAREVLSSFRCVDEMFCIDSEWAKYIKHFFPKEVRRLPLAANPEDFYPMPDEKKVYDLAYVASAPEQSPDGLLRANLANSIPDKYKVAVAGNGWRYWLRYFPKLKDRIISYGAIGVKDLNRLYNQSEIVLNFHSTMHAASVSPRVFEAGLTGVFQLTDFREDLKLLGLDKFCALYSSPDDLRESLRTWLPKKDERLELARGMREAVLGSHTWRRRAEEILGVYNEKYAK